MQKEEWSVMYQSDWMNIEQSLFTYNEDEKQDNEINRENAKLIFTPKFIPFYPKLIKLGLSITECLIYWFIDFYIQDKNSRFYFTNEQLWNIFQLWWQTVSNSVKRLKDVWLIDLKYKIKANWWTIRFIEKLWQDYKNDYSPTIKKFIPNNNKIKDNNIKDNILSNDNTKSLDFVSKNRKDIDLLIIDIKQLCNEIWIAYDKNKERQFWKHICDSKDFWEFCEKIWQDRLEFSKNILLASVKINYWKWPCSWTMKIYQNYVEVYNLTKAINTKKEKSKISFIPWI